MIGVLVLITSTTAVTVLNNQDESESETPDIGLAMDRTEAATQAAAREAVSEGLQEAAQAPVTETSSNDVGNAIEPDGSFANQSERADAVFQRYIKLRIYLNARERIARTDQRLQDGTTTNATLPPVGDTETEIESTLDSMDMDVGMYDDDVPDGQVQVTIPDVQITVNSENGSQLAQRTTSVNTSVPTTVFQLHEKNQEYQKRLNTGFFEGFEEGIGYGFGQQYAARQYPVSWAKVYFDRFYSGDAAFDPVHNNRHTEILANDAVYSEQKAAFGTTDPYEDRIMRERWACFGLTTLYKLWGVRGTAASDDSETASNLTQAINQTYLTNFTNRLNATLQQHPSNPVPQDPTNWNEDDICQATRLVFGDNTGSLNSAPELTEMVSGLFQGTSGDSREQNESEVKIDPYANAAYHEIQGDVVTDELADNLDSREENPDSIEGAGGSYDEHDTSEFNDPDEGSSASDFDNQIENIIEDTYDVGVDVTDSSSGGSLPTADSKDTGEWSEDSSSYDVDNDDVTVTTSPTTETERGDRETDLYTISVDVTNDITHTREWSEDCNGNESGSECDGEDTTTEDKTITFSVDIDIDATHSRGSGFDVRGVEDAYESGGPGPGPNFGDVRHQVTRDVFDTDATGLKNELESRISAEDIQDISTLESQLDYSTSASVDASLDSSDKSDLKEWIREDINETRGELISQVDSVNITRRELASGEGDLSELRNQTENKRNDVVYQPLSGDGGKYANPKERARAEAQDYYLDKVIEWINEVEDEQEAASNDAGSKIDSSLSEVDSDIDEALEFAQDALAGDVGSGTGSIAGTPQDRDAEIRISASPSYLSRSSMGQDKIPAARAEDEGPLNTSSSATHTGLTIKQDNIFLPHPGFPLIPWPGYWYGTLSSWRIQMEGEYARFETQTTTNNPTTSSPTTYVRDERPVDLEINGQTETVGRVNPINFSSTTLVVAVVPSVQVIATGGAGIGDAGSRTPPQGWRSCTGTYPHVGPNAASQGSSCTYILEDD